MSDSLDKLFRDAQRSVPPATPPPGQWDRIRAGELTVPAGAKRPVFVWWLGLALCAGLGMGVPLGGYVFGGECPAEALTGSSAERPGNSNPFARPRVQGELAEAMSPAENTAPLTSTAPASAPRKASRPNPLSPSDAQATQRPLAAPAAPENRRTTGQDTALRPEPDDAPPGSPATPAPGEKPRTTPPGIDKLTAPGPVPVSVSGPLRPRYLLAAKTTGLKVIPVDIGRKSYDPLTRWEVGLNVAPLLLRRYAFGQTYTTADNGGTPREVSFGGQNLNLYDARFFRLNLPRRLALHSLNLRAARQFRNGLRLGIGFDWTPNSFASINRASQLPVGQLQGREWATFSTWQYQRINASVIADYTFLRRRRLRPYLGVMVSSPLYLRSERTAYLQELSTGRAEVTELVRDIRTFDFTNRWTQFRLGAQYDLGSRISVGLEVVPDAALGVRWKL